MSEAQSLTILILYRKHIASLNLQDVDKMLDTFRKGGLKKYKGKVVFEVDGYDEDPREIFEIPEIRAFYKKVFHKYPYLLYFLSSTHSSDAWVLACLCDTFQTTNAVGAQNVRMKMDFPDNLLNHLIEESASFMKRIGESSRNILELRVRLAAMAIANT